MPKAKDLMNTDLISVEPDDTIDKAICTMLKYGLSGLPVVDSSGHVLGVVSEFDLLDLVWNPQTDQDRVCHHMTSDVRKVDENTDLSNVAELFRTLSIRRLPVMRGDRMVGVISRHDLLRHVLQARGQIAPVTPRLLSLAASPIPDSAGI